MKIFTVPGLTIALSLMLLAGAAVAQDTDKVWRIGVLSRVKPPAANLAAFRQGMRDRGRIEGRSYVLVPGWGKSGGKREKLGILARKLAARRVDLIVTAGWRAARAANRAAPSIPVVMASSADPVRTGVIESLAKPGGNVTGMTSATVDVHMKRMEILKQILPDLRRVAEIRRERREGRDRRHDPLWAGVDDHAAKVFGVEFLKFSVGKAGDFDALFRRVTESGADAFIVRSITFFTPVERRQLVEAALRAGLPGILTARRMVEMGGLASFGVHQPWMYRRAAAYVDKILKGAKPRDLPVERPTRFELVFNMKTAEALGVTVPRALLLRADEVFE